MTRAVRFKRLKGFFTLVGVAVSALIIIMIIVGLFIGESGLSHSDKVGVVKVDGIILDSTEINRQIKEFIRRDDIKGVVIRINSPGGSVAPSQEIYRQILRLREHKKVVASMSSVAASGGYYIALGADKIVANPGTITGSIGVIVKFMNFEGLLDKVGLVSNVIKSGKFKDTGSPLRKMNREEKALIQGLVDDVHNQFVEAVAEGRGIDIDIVRRLADGRIYSGSQAIENGLVDELGGMNEAVELVAGLAGMDSAREPEVVYAKRKVGGFWRFIMNDGPGNLLSGLYSGLNVMYLFRPIN